MTAPGPFRAGLRPIPARADLEQEWKALEDRADGSFFTSWIWIGCWLESLPTAIRPMVLRIAKGDRTVGLGILVKKRIWRSGVVPSRALFLNATGDSELDELTVEYNGLLAERGREHDVLRGACKALLARRGWDEWVLDAVQMAPSTGAADAELTVIVDHERPCHSVQLRRLGSSVDAYLAELGQKTRYNIRRSLKAYGEICPVRLDEAGTAGEAAACLDGLKQLHQAHWTSRGRRGSFGNRFFDQFHARFVREAPKGAVQLLRIRAGDVVIGYLYNFVYRGYVYSYTAGFNYAVVSEQNRPGLVAHALAIEHNRQAGHAVYDLMAGHGEYKQSLGTSSSTLGWYVVRRNRRRWAIERALRAVRGQSPAVQTRPAEEGAGR